MISQVTTLRAHVTGWSIRNSFGNKRHLYALRFCKFSQRCNWYFPSSGIWHRFAGHLALQTSRLLPTNPWRDIKLQKNKSHMSRLGANFPPRYEYNMKDVTNNLFVKKQKQRIEMLDVSFDCCHFNKSPTQSSTAMVGSCRLGLWGPG